MRTTNLTKFEVDFRWFWSAGDGNGTLRRGARYA